MDILVFTNTVIDFLLLCLTELILRKSFAVHRLIIASILGGLSSLYILIEGSNSMMDLSYKLFSGIVMMITLLGITKPKNYAYAFITFMLFSFLVSGVALFIAEKLNCDVVVASNFQQYIQISPIVLLSVTAGVYILVRMLQKQMRMRKGDMIAQLELFVCDNTVSCTALLDSGCDINDPLSSSQVFVLCEKKYKMLEQMLEPSEIRKRSRVIPVDTVGESCLLYGLRCDRATVKCEGESYVFEKVIVVASKENIRSDFEAVISLDCIDRLSDRKSDRNGIKANCK